MKFAGIPELKQALYEIAQKIPDPRDRQNKLMGRCIPKSYLELEKLLSSELQTLLENKKPPFLTEQSYKDLFNKIPNSDIEDLEIVQGWLLCIHRFFGDGLQVCGASRWDSHWQGKTEFWEDLWVEHFQGYDFRPSS